MPDADTRVLLVEFDGRGENRGIHRVTIPANSKVTFSGVNPQHGGMGEKALRVYQGKDNQLACFVGVRSFRDPGAVKVEKRRRDVKVTHEEETRRQGKRVEHAVEVGAEEWVDVTEATGEDASAF